MSSNLSFEEKKIVGILSELHLGDEYQKSKKKSTVPIKSSKKIISKISNNEILNNKILLPPKVFICDNIKVVWVNISPNQNKNI